MSHHHAPPQRGDPMTSQRPAAPSGTGAPGAKAPRTLEGDRRWLRHAARLGWRGHGGAEPNPCVGAVIVSPAGALIGEGFHARCGGPHAEIAALGDAAERRRDPRGATMYVTLEPCHRQGRTAPCSEAIIGHGIREVVVARRDPHPKGEGGLEALAAAGVRTRVVEEPAAALVAAPFAWRVRSGLPWVVAKWAQTLDGRIGTRGGDSRWISSARSRAMVHRERGRVDAILTGIGTVLADDPLLTARDVRVRRLARRVLVDPNLRIPLSSNLLQTIGEAPLTIACARARLDAPEAQVLRARGVELVGLPSRAADGSLELRELLRHLGEAHSAATVLVEAGPGLVGSLIGQGLVDMAWVFVAPLLMADPGAPGPVGELVGASLAPDEGMSALREDPRRCLQLIEQRRRGPDAMLLYVRRGPVPT